MRLAGIRPVDIVRGDDGSPCFAEVIERDGTRVPIAPITGPCGCALTSRSCQVSLSSGERILLDCCTS